MLLKRIADHADQLRPSEQRVAEFIRTRPRIAAEITIADLAMAADVSEPTVVRFCRAIGFRGFSEVKRTLQTELASVTFLTNRGSHTRARVVPGVASHVDSSDASASNQLSLQEVCRAIASAPSCGVVAGTPLFQGLATALRERLGTMGIKALDRSEGLAVVISLGGPGTVSASTDGDARHTVEVEIGPPADALSKLGAATGFAVALCQALEGYAGRAGAGRQASSEAAWERGRIRANGPYGEIAGAPGAVPPSTGDEVTEELGQG